MKRYPEPGSISWGTLRIEDLIPAFMDVLEGYAPTKAAQLRREYADVLAALEEGREHEDADWLLQDLELALDEIAPPGCYFGVHPGDALDFGFWPLLDGLA